MLTVTVLQILFARAEALHAHGHTKEACHLAQQLAEEMLLHPPDLFANTTSGTTTPKCEHQGKWEWNWSGKGGGEGMCYSSHLSVHPMGSLWTISNTCVHMCTHTNTHTHTHMCIQACKHIHTHAHTCTHLLLYECYQILIVTQLCSFCPQLKRRRHWTRSPCWPVPHWPRPPSCVVCCPRTLSVTISLSKSACLAWN